MVQASQCLSQYDQLYGVAEGDIEQSPQSVSQSASHALCRVGEQAGQGYDSDGIHGEDNLGIQAGKVCGDADRYEDEQHIDPAMQDCLFRMGAKSLYAILYAGRNIVFPGWSILLYGGRFLSMSFGIRRGRAGGRRSWRRIVWDGGVLL